MATAAEIEGIISANNTLASDLVSAMQAQLAGINWTIEGATPPEAPDTSALASLASWTPTAVPRFSDSYDFTPSVVIDTIDTDALEVPDFSAIQLREPPAPLNIDSLFSSISAPSNNIGAFNEALPAFAPPTLPDAPSLNYPQSPQTVAVNLPSRPSVTPPTFDNEFTLDTQPNADADIGHGVTDGLSLAGIRDAAATLGGYAESRSGDLVAQFTFFDPQPIITGIGATILAALATQPSAGERASLLQPDFEDSLWQRGRDRIQAERQGADSEVLEGLGRRGFGHVLPPGYLNAGFHKNQVAAHKAMAAHGAEVAIERAKLELDTRFKLFDIAKGYYDTLVDLKTKYLGVMLQANEQAIGWARTMGEMLAQRYNYAVSVYNASINLYEARARVYDTQLKGALAELEVYRATIEGEKVRKELSAVDAQIYESAVRGLLAQAQVYDTLVRGEMAKAELAKAQADVFRAKVEAFVGTVQAKKAEFEGFAAAVQGKQAVAQAYSAAVQGYAEEAKTKIAAAELEVEKLKAQVAQYQVKAAVVQAQSSAYETEARAAADAFRAKVAAFDAEMQAVRTSNEAQSSRYTAEVQRAGAMAQASIGAYHAQAAYNQGTLQQLMNFVEGARTSSIQAAKVAGDVAAAAISANNTLLSSNAITNE